MSKLKLILLGQFECLLSSGERISLAMRKAEVLLAYLALAPGIRHPRERLINLLWSDRGEEQARNSLRQCLSAIRKSLGDAADLILQIDRTTVSLKPGLIDVDALEFEQLAMEGDFESLSTAAGLYRGEFLEGISIRDAASQDWLDSERARFKRQFVEILMNLGETQLVSHDFHAAIRSTERLVEQDPLGESGWRLLMRSYAANGDRSHALQAFNRCQKSIRDELNVDPEAATIELREQIATGGSNSTQTPTKVTLSTETPVPTDPAIEKESADSESSTDHSIAVLPFDNLSGDPEQEYFSDGITDSIILNLSLFPGLQVKSRNSSFAFKQQIKSPGEISQELEVDYIVEGSIRKSHDRVRITVQLIEATSGNHVWGKRYDAEIEGLFDLEEELSRTIAATVTGQIDSDLQRIAIAKSAAGQESYDLLLSGTYHAYRFNRQDTVIAIDQLNQCLAQDPDNIRAHAMLYTCHSMDSLERWTQDYQASFRLAEEHIRKALALDPEIGLVQVAYGEFLTFRGDLKEAAIHLDKALEINPNDPDALTTKALNLELQGKFEASLKSAERAIMLDPYHPWAEWELAVAQYFCAHYETALETITRSRTSPGFIQIFVVVSNVKLGRVETARQALQNFLRECRENMLSMPQTLDEWFIYTRENYQYADPQLNQDIIDCLVQAGLEDYLSAPTSPEQSDEHSIAVLPFDNLSGDPEQEYFSDGITDSIILNLSRFPGLQVKSRNSSFAFKQQIKSLGEISRELNVDYIVEGSIRKSVDRIRITVQLIEAASGNQVWGKRYDAEIANLFDLEEELSRSIAATVTGQIETDLQRIAITRGAADQQAYDLLLNGTYHLKQANRDNVAIAIEEFNQCILKDPDNAVAHAKLFYCHDINVMDHWTEDVQHSRELAAKHIHKAVSLEPDVGFIQVAYANYLMFIHQFDEAEYQLKRAMDTNPNDTEAIAMRAVNFSLQGKAEAALEQAELALKLDPYHSWVKWIKAESQFFCGRYADCLATISDTENVPAFIRIYTVGANIRLSEPDNAKKALEHFLRFCRETMLSVPGNIQEWLGYYRDNAPFADPEINQKIIDYLVQAGLEEELTASRQEDDPTQQPSILVLPFSNLSGDPEQEYFSDGITESIILSLSASQGLQVKSRHTSFAYKDSALSVSQIGTELEVQYIVEGSIRKHGDQVRITVQLGETESGNQIWGKRYDKPLEQLFSLEEELVQTITGTISGRIGHEIKITSIQKPARNLKSYDYLMRGCYHTERFTPEDAFAAIDQFNKCLEIDPNNVEAHTMLSAVTNVLLYENWTDDRQQAKTIAKKHIFRALELEPNHALAQAFMAEHYLFTKDFAKAMHHANKAIEFDPALPDGYSYKAYILSVTGNTEEALQVAEVSMQIDPYHYYMGWNAGEVNRNAGQFEGAIDAFRSIPVTPASILAEIATCQQGLGQLNEAKATMAEYRRLARGQMPNFPTTIEAWRSLWDENVPFESSEVFDAFFDLLLQAGLCDDIAEDTDEMPSLLVLPLSNLSGDPEQEYFSDGVSESIIVNLSSFNGLNVKSRHTSFAFKNSEKGIDEIAEELAVQYIVEGSIRKFGDKIRITVQLSETESGNQLWGERFESELEDLFALEEKLVKNITGNLGGRIGKEIVSASMRKPAKDLKSYDYLMRGMHHLQQFSFEQNSVAREQFEKCLEHDSGNSEAHACLGLSYLTDLYENWSVDRAEARRLMMTHAETALQIEPNDALAHASMAESFLYLRNFDRAAYHVERAMELNPNLSDCYSMKCYYLTATRQHEAALENADISLQIDPHHFYMCWNAGEVYRACGQYERAVKTFRSMPHMPPSVHAQIAAALAGLGKTDEARSEMQQYLEAARRDMPSVPTDEDEWRSFWYEHMPYQYEEDSETLFQLLLKAGLCGD